MNDAHGLPLTGANAAAIDHLETALHLTRCYMGDPVAATQAAIDAAPGMPMGPLLMAWLHLLGSEPAGVPVARAAHARAAELALNDRERGHLLAIGQLLEGRWRDAGRTLEDLTIAYPLDVLALQAGQAVDFFTGDSRMLHDRIARAMPAWRPGMPALHGVLGMLAFGLEETGHYARAEAAGRRAVALEPNDGWGQHAVAHVLEMQDRRSEGIAWMRGNPGWQEPGSLAVHNWWHLALFHLGLDQVDEALTLLDERVLGTASPFALDMVDASSLLWRLELRGIDVGDRWQALADRWAPHAPTGFYAFNDMHAMMAFTGAGRDDLADQLLAAQVEALERAGDNADFTRDVGQAATRAVQAWRRGEPAAAVRLLRPVRSRSHRFGGSHAQRDVIDLTLIAAAERSGQAGLAAALRHERESRQPSF